MDRLVQNADMTHDGNSRLNDFSHMVANLATAFHLDRFHTRLLNQPCGIPKGIFRADLKGHERHIGH